MFTPPPCRLDPPCDHPARHCLGICPSQSCAVQLNTGISSEANEYFTQALRRTQVGSCAEKIKHGTQGKTSVQGQPRVHPSQTHKHDDYVNCPPDEAQKLKFYALHRRHYCTTYFTTSFTDRSIERIPAYDLQAPHGNPRACTIKLCAPAH